eukprot:COSAG02_NODE_27_length_51735_cov_86.076749_25_plen_181_part_00
MKVSLDTDEVAKVDDSGCRNDSGCHNDSGTTKQDGGGGERDAGNEDSCGDASDDETTKLIQQAKSEEGGDVLEDFFTPIKASSTSVSFSSSSSLYIINKGETFSALVAGCRVQCCMHGCYMEHCTACDVDFSSPNRAILGEALADRLVEGEYFVKWQGFNVEDYTWEKERDVVGKGEQYQ